VPFVVHAFISTTKDTKVHEGNCAVQATGPNPLKSFFLPTHPEHARSTIMMTTRIKAGFSSALLFLTLLAGSTAAAQAQQKPEELAQQSAGSWLALVDSGKYPDSWQEAAQLFRAAVSKEQWQSAMRASREPLGKMLSRKVTSATYSKTLPGAPDGEYVVIRYDSRFEHKQSAVETVTPMLDKDGKWRVSGYYIK
jgi:hypothetical protein